MLGILLFNPSEQIINRICDLNEDKGEYCIFSASPTTEKARNISQLQPLRAYNFKETLIASDIRTAEFAVNLSLPRKKFFYIRSCEWVRATSLLYEDLKKIYLNDNMDLIVSNSKDYKLISNLFKKPKYIVEDWDFEELLNDCEK